MKNRKLKNSIRKHFEQVNLNYNKNVFDEFFKSFNNCYHTDQLDLSKKRDKSVYYLFNQKRGGDE